MLIDYSITLLAAWLLRVKSFLRGRMRWQKIVFAQTW